MLALDAMTVDEVDELVRRAAPFAGLPRSALEAVLDMLAGRYPSDAFAELRPRIVWDRVTGELTARRGAQRLAVTSGGTIPDRGLFGVFLAGADGPGRRVGELDEEMVYESRVGDVFLLGSSSWRIEDITHDRVLVTPAPGEVGRMPFWKGDSPGRPVELGRALGAFLREVAHATPGRRRGPGPSRRARRVGHRQPAGLPARTDVRPPITCPTTARSWSSGSATSSATGAWSCTRRSARRSTRPGRWPSRPGCASASGSRCPRCTPMTASCCACPTPTPNPRRARSRSSSPRRSSPSSPRRSAVRRCSPRAFASAPRARCCLPRRDPRRRTPLWQQRQRANQLLQVASEYGDFPVVLEAMRECLQDVFDVPGPGGADA